MGVELKRRRELWRAEDSVEQLAQLARTADFMVERRMVETRANGARDETDFMYEGARLRGRVAFQLRRKEAGDQAPG